MLSKKGMYILSDSENPDNYYERALKDIYIITDEEDLQLGLTDWLESYSYQLLPDEPVGVKELRSGNYEVEVKVLNVTEAVLYTCYLIKIPKAKEALQKKEP